MKHHTNISSYFAFNSSKLAVELLIFRMCKAYLSNWNHSCKCRLACRFNQMMWSWWSVPLHIGRQAFFVKSFLLIASNSRNSEAVFWYIFEYGSSIYRRWADPEDARICHLYHRWYISCSQLYHKSIFSLVYMIFYFHRA